MTAGWTKTAVLKEREDGILSALEEKAEDKYSIVASQEGIIAAECRTGRPHNKQNYIKKETVILIGTEGLCLKVFRSFL